MLSFTSLVHDGSVTIPAMRAQDACGICARGLPVRIIDKAGSADDLEMVSDDSRAEKASAG